MTRVTSSGSGVSGATMPERAPLRANLAVSGVFHYRRYIRHLAARGVLNRFFYSHKRSTTAAELGISNEQAVNLSLKEYLTHAHLGLVSHRFGNLLFPIYQELFDRGVVRNWSDCDVLHVMLHGASLRTIAKGRASGAAVIGEPVNSHPEFVQRLLREEHQRLGLPDTVVRGLNRGQAQTIKESSQCDFLVTPSTFVAKSYSERGFPNERIRVIPWGTDLAQFSPGQRTSDGVFRVLCVAQVSTRKGHIDLINACRLLNVPDLRLVLIGSMTPEMSGVLSSLSEWFDYRGAVPHSDLVHEFRQADVVVLPSIEDGFSYVPLEAMACGVPVIVSENAGASELVEEGRTGFVVPIRNAEAIARALEVLYREPERRRAMGMAASESMRRSHGWENYAERLAATYIELEKIRAA